MKHRNRIKEQMTVGLNLSLAYKTVLAAIIKMGEIKTDDYHVVKEKGSLYPGL